MTARIIYLLLAFVGTYRPVIMTAGRRDWLVGQEQFINELAKRQEITCRALDATRPDPDGGAR